MNKTSKRKLVLRASTLRMLTSDQLVAAGGWRTINQSATCLLTTCDQQGCATDGGCN